MLVHLIRYHDVLAPHAADRAQIVPGPEVTEGAAATGTPVPSGGRIQRSGVGGPVGPGFLPSR